MYAIVEIAGHQYKVRKDQQVYVNRLEGSEGDSVSFDKVLLTDDNGSVEVGAPVINGIKVDAQIVSHLKADKVIVFKKKRRKGYRKKNGHRQAISLIQIMGIGKGSSKASARAEAKPVAKKEAPKAEAPKETAAPKKTAAPKQAAAHDDLTRLNGVGPKVAAEFEKNGYTSYEQISKLNKADTAELTEKVSGISAEQMEEIKEQAKILFGYKKVSDKVGTAVADDKDDLTAITGIGPVTEKELNSAGIFTYEQISKLGAKEMEYLSALSGVTKETIQSEEWVKQAKELLK